MEYKGTLTSAKEFAVQGKTEEWVHAYLTTDGHNQPFSEGLKLCPRYYIGPLPMPLSLFTRCSGPEESMKWRVDPDGFEKHVTWLADVIKSGADMPPLIVHYLIGQGKTEGTFELNDGNRRWEAFRRLGISEYDTIVWITEKSELDQFRERYINN